MFKRFLQGICEKKAPYNETGLLQPEEKAWMEDVTTCR